jgi:CDI immunity protein
MKQVTRKVIRGWYASIKSNNDFIDIYTRSGYSGGLNADYQSKEHLLPLDVSDAELGAALRDALAHSRFVLGSPRTDVWVHPDVEYDMELCDLNKGVQRYKDWIARLMAAYGYKTKRALFKDMKNCSVDLREGMISISPFFHEKLEAWSGEGITKEDDVHIPEICSDAELGAAIRLALSRCL